MSGFDFEEQRIKQQIVRLDAKRVLLQMPQGLKPQATRLAKLVEDYGAVPIISSDPCYGACDIAETEAASLGVDLIVHFGHTRLVKEEKTPTLYIEAYSDIKIDAAVTQALPLLSSYRSVGLVTSIQHILTVETAKQLLTQAGKVVFVGDAGQMGYAGQVIGCNYSNATAITRQVDAFLFLGGGMFHALGVALATGKPTVVADPYDSRAYTVDDEAGRILKQRYAGIQEAKNAKSISILVGLKPGQKHLDYALQVKAMAEKTGRAAFVLAGRELTPEVLLDFTSIDAYVNTACPRISLDAPGKFKKPMLTVNEFRVVCGEVSWTDMLKKGLFEN
ncbi:MAG: diphthamide biosynthesis enzyme Dph2 [Candidatus Bathyarchaeota archaeon]|nr:diphthamide biosynthesis enzyme Dph2 [Candidatus Bathyarchaeota archaeon]